MYGMLQKFKYKILSCKTVMGGIRPFHTLRKYKEGEKKNTNKNKIKKFFLEKIFFQSKINRNNPKLIIIQFCLEKKAQTEKKIAAIKKK